MQAPCLIATAVHRIMQVQILSIYKLCSFFLRALALSVICDYNFCLMTLEFGPWPIHISVEVY